MNTRPSPDWNRVWEAFHRLQADADSLEPGLSDLRAQDPALAEEVESLLAASNARNEAPDQRDLLDLGVGGFSDLLEALETGDLVDRYEVLSKVGEGGAGSVYRARRIDGEFDRDGALKLLRPDVSSPEMLQRFRQERELLASFDHESIARIHDAGVTEEGAPFLALEFVEGLPMDVWSRRERPSMERLLETFVRVCNAVAYAHRRSVVHRDLKPSNVLVIPRHPEEVGPGDRVKLLDFGIAKVLGSGAAPVDRTATHNRMLTPRYASPEQLRGDPVTTASDVYSLGVLLYELVSGGSPYGDAVSSSADLLVSILETEPPRPSVAARRRARQEDSRSGTTATDSTGDGDQSTTGFQPHRLRGDLDAIVLRCLAKDPDRRYASVSELSADIQRFLDHRPVLAQPDSVLYRLKKVSRRRPVATTATLLASGALVMFAVVTGLLAMELRDALESERAQRMEAERTSRFLAELVEGANPILRPGSEPTARDLLTAGMEQLRMGDLESNTRARLGVVIARALLALEQVDRAQGVVDDLLLPLLPELSAVRAAEVWRAAAQIASARADYALAGDLYDRAEDLLEGAEDDQAQTVRYLNQLDQGLTRLKIGGGLGEIEELHDLVRSPPRNLDWRSQSDALSALSIALVDMRRYAEAESFARERLGLLESVPEASSAARGHARETLAIALWGLNRLPEARAAYERAIQELESALGPDSARLPLNGLAVVLHGMGQFEEARALFERAIANEVRAFGQDSPKLADEFLSLGWNLHNTGHFDEARLYYDRALEMERRNLPNGGAPMVPALNNLGLLEMDMGRHEQARPYFEEMERLVIDHLGPTSSALGFLWTNVARLEQETGNLSESERLYREALRLRREVLGPRHIELGLTLTGLGDLLCGDGRFEEGEAALREALSIRREKAAATDWRVALTENALGHCLVLQGRSDQGLPLLRDSIEPIHAQRGTRDPRARLALQRLQTAEGRNARTSESRD